MKSTMLSTGLLLLAMASLVSLVSVESVLAKVALSFLSVFFIALFTVAHAPGDKTR